MAGLAQSHPTGWLFFGTYQKNRIFATMTRKERLHMRNEKVRDLFDQISKKNPKWRIDAIIDDIVKMVHLSPRTIEAILRGEGSYGETPQPTNQQKLQL